MYKYRDGDYLSVANLRKLREHVEQLDAVYKVHPDLVTKMVDSDINEHSFRDRIRKLYRKLGAVSSAG